MSNKMVKVDIITNPNSMVTVVGRDMGAISAQSVQAVLDYALSETKTYVQEARVQGKFIPLIAEESKIKSVLIMNNGVVYPSSFRVVTLMERIRATTDTLQKIQENEAS